MNHHPVLIERCATGRRRTLLHAAEASRSVRAAQAPKPKRRWIFWAERPVLLTPKVCLAR